MPVICVLRQFSRRFSVLMFSLAAFCLLSGTLLFDLYEDREGTLAAAAANAERISRVLEEHTRDTLVAVDAVLLTTAAHLQSLEGSDHGDPAGVEAVLKQAQASLGFLYSLSLLGVDGHSVVSSRGAPVWAGTPSSRGFFQAHAAGQKDLIISPPIRSDLDGTWIIPLSRRVETRDGSPAGILVAALEPRHLKAFYETLQIGAGNCAALLLSDGTLLVSDRNDETQIGRWLGNATLFREQLPKADAGTFRERSPIDGVERIYGYRRFAGLPLVALAGISSEKALASWREQRDKTAILWFLAGLGLLVLAVLLARQQERERLAASALRESERRYRLLAENASDAITVFDASSRRTYASPAVRRLLGYEPEELVGIPDLELTHPEDAQRLGEVAAEVMVGEGTATVEYRFRRQDGSYFWAEVSLRRFTDPEAPTRPEIVAVIRDISRRKAMEDELRESHERLNFALEASGAGAWNFDLATNRTTWSDGNFRIYGFDPAKAVPSHEEWLGVIHPDDRAAVDAATRAIALHQGSNLNFEFRMLHPELGLRWLASRGRLVRNSEGGSMRVSGLNFDVTALKAMDEALRAGEERLRLSEGHLARAQLVAQTGSWELDHRSGGVYWSAGMHRIFGLPETYRPNLKSVLSLLDEDMRDRLQAILAQAMNGMPSQGAEFRLARPDGDIRFAWCECEPLFDEAGEVERIVGTLQDITEIRQGEERRRELERELLQAQKMETIGQLTGGIAHDFNNLLAVVIGNLDLVESSPGLTADARDLITAARDAGLRGAELTTRLLAFARRQPLQPQVIDLNATIADHTRLLQRLLGRDIEVRLDLDAALGRVELDPVQFETALTNLVTNARDAMPRGGRLTIATSNMRLDPGTDRESELSPGHYALVEISDTGVGMGPEVLARVFEPFFTTKKMGSGTGLGLSMVYGFTKQSGGHVGVDSRPGEGTTVRVYLPWAHGDGPALVSRRAGDGTSPARGESVLVVEDDPDVRGLLARQLTTLGYSVTEAADGPTALGLLQGGAPFDLLMTDIVMPGGITGDELAQRARIQRPGLKVLLTSGFPATALGERGLLDEGAAFLAKPYRKQELAEKVQSALGR